MASVVAKSLLNGEEIIIVNAEKAIVSGNRTSIMSEYKRSRDQGKIRKGPFFPRMPDRILRRTVSRMMQHQKTHGKDAMSRLKVYIGVPEEFREEKFETLDKVRKTGTLQRYMTLGDISRQLGAKF